MEKIITPHILGDMPCIDINQAQFQFKAYANTLATIILSKDNKTPLVIGVYGNWGSGKTSLMQIVKTKVEEKRNIKENNQIPSFMHEEDPNTFRPCKTVWFNAWKYSKEEELWVSLIDAIGRELRKDSDLLKKIKEKASDFKRKYKWSKAMLSTMTQLLSYGRVNLNIEESRFAQNVAFYDEFQNFFDEIIADFTKRETGGALVIFIDDLDRCLPSKVIGLLEAIKLFMDRPGCIFLIGTDPKMITSAIQAHYDTHGIKEMSAEEYLDKIVQIHFTLPPPRSDDIKAFIRNLPGLEPFTRDQLELIASGVPTNPRRIKTFVNYIELQWALLVNIGLGELKDKQNLAEWLMLNEVSPAFREEVQSGKSEASIITLIDKLKELANLKPAERKKQTKADEELSKFANSETLFKVLKHGRFRFSQKEIGVYVHLSPAPALSSREEIIQKIDEVLDELLPRERRVLQLRFGLKDGKARTYKEVGQEFNLTGERIRQIEAKALRKLRHPGRSGRLRHYHSGESESHSSEDDLIPAIFGEK